MDDQEPHHREPVNRPGEGRIIDVSGKDPVIVEEESGFPFGTGGIERVRVFTTSGDARTCVVPAVLFLFLLCCSCIAIWSLTDNIF